ncbi:MAG: SET domain-containing protein-lysine N-methyltransferase [Planctomycetes bacterium]|nr:SET domain-containing protein-lysine N-methyltransferase [Planctomycetota bacterium]
MDRPDVVLECRDAEAVHPFGRPRSTRGWGGLLGRFARALEKRDKAAHESRADPNVSPRSPTPSSRRSSTSQYRRRRRPEMDESCSEDLLLRRAGSKGLGVFAARSFAPGEHVLTFGGERLPHGEIADFTHTIQVDEEHFLGPSGGVDDYVNHSCEPTCQVRAVRGGLELVARRVLEAGDEVTFDYSTCLVLEPPMSHCSCGSADCRRRVVSFWELAPGWRRRYLLQGAVPGFVVRSRAVLRPAARRAEERATRRVQRAQRRG